MAGISVLPSTADIAASEFIPSLPQIALALGTFTAGHGLLTLVMVQAAESRAIRRLSAITTASICMIGILNCDRSTIWGGQFSMYMFGLLMQSNMLLALIPTVIPKFIPAWKRIRRALSIQFTGRLSYQRIQTLSNTSPWVVKKASRGAKMAFLRQRLIVMTWSSILFYLAAYRYRPFMIPYNDIIAAGSSMSITQRLSTIDLHHFRSLFLVEALGDLQQFWMLQIVHGLVAINAVLIFNDDPQDWPPMYGDIREAYTMGRFYTHWWHRIMRKMLVENAKMLASWMVIMPSSVRSSRLVTVIMSFLVSAAVHGIAMSPSNNCLDVRCSMYFVILAIIVPLEETIQLLYRRLRGKQQMTDRMTGSETHGANRRPISPWRYIGYLWVIAVKCWIVPKSLSSTTFCLTK